jgi:hypothetical protein
MDSPAPFFCNNDGGRFLIGFDDKTMQPVAEGRPANVRDTYHQDVVQSVVSKHVSDPFPVRVDFPVRDGLEFPVITVPNGVSVPVVVKGDVFDQTSNRSLLQDGALLVRTVRDGQVGSSAPNHRDLERLMRICVDNTYADFSQFLSRFLSHRELGVLHEVVAEVAPEVVPVTSDDVLELGFQRFQTAVAERQLTLPPFGTWEVGVKLLPPPTGFEADRHFLDVLNNSNPRLTGWPMWLDTRGSPQVGDRPYRVEGAWEVLINALGGWGSHFDFMRLEPTGRFYLLRALEDDVNQDGVTPGTVLDYRLPIWRVADVIATSLEFARGLGALDDSQLILAFRWRGLKGRRLASWANPGRSSLDVFPNTTILQDQVTARGNLEVGAAENRVVTLTHDLLRPLVAAFDGTILSLAVVQNEVDGLMKRRH